MRPSPASASAALPLAAGSVGGRSRRQAPRTDSCAPRQRQLLLPCPLPPGVSAAGAAAKPHGRVHAPPASVSFCCLAPCRRECQRQEAAAKPHGRVHAPPASISACCLAPCRRECRRQEPPPSPMDGFMRLPPASAPAALPLAAGSVGGRSRRQAPWMGSCVSRRQGARQQARSGAARGKAADATKRSKQAAR